MIYVRHPHRDSWHWFSDCSSVRWSLKKGNLITVEVPDGERPKTFELCSQCLAKERKGTGVPI